MKIHRRSKLKILKLLVLIVGITGILALISNIFPGKNQGNRNLTIISSDQLKKMDFKEAIKLEENASFEKYILTFEKEVSKFDGTNYSTGYKVTIPSSKLQGVELSKDTPYGFNTDVEIINDGSGLQVVIPTTFDENFLYQNPIDKREIIILIAKSDDPYTHSVTLDPGHGGIDIGTSYGNFYEKDITLKIASYMKMDLIYNGNKVVMTREDDNVTLGEREWLAQITKVANTEKTDILVSVHINSFTTPEPEGIITYYYTVGHEEQAAEREALATAIQKNVVSTDGWKDNGIRTENFQVLRDSTMPSVLVEAGYISNSADRARLQKEEVLINIADSINKGIMEYLNSKE